MEVRRSGLWASALVQAQATRNQLRKSRTRSRTRLRISSRGLYVGQQLPTLLDISCCVRLHTLLHVVGSCCIRLHTLATRDATTRNIVGATMLGVVASVARVNYITCRCFVKNFMGITPSSIYIILHVWLFIEIVPTSKHANSLRLCSLASSKHFTVPRHFFGVRGCLFLEIFFMYHRVAIRREVSVLSFCVMFGGSSFGVFRLLITCKILRHHTWLIIFLIFFLLQIGWSPTEMN